MLKLWNTQGQGRKCAVEGTEWRIRTCKAKGTTKFAIYIFLLVLTMVLMKVIVLHVGTNNYDNNPEEIKDGIIEIIHIIREKHPDVYIVIPVRLCLLMA